MKCVRLYTNCDDAWDDAWNRALENAATLVELEYAADKKMADRLKMIAQHIRDMKIEEDADA